MNIDCRDLACPEPVINTKKSLESLGDEGILEVLVNSTASKENVIRFATNEGCSVSDESTEDGSVKITIVKGFACGITTEEEGDKFLNKVLFLKDDKVGDNELGSMLVVGFLKSILELPKLPKTIICVNRGVFLTSAAADSDIINILKVYEEKGVEIYSCGVCLDFYKRSDELKVGMVGNAYGTVDMLLNSEGTITL
ncbi:sulfurtransferase-like selenium metabolism protein YedF [Sulfurospirillum arcachonense]|uniref:sulfurtransferase-like selenium metabolism protein YedF n=1 Tax=Sulfurospirillum arcachonense TaxID=57666 RepID=UPI00046AED2C|nr:sulfurtransferase-like selenium metabolism protein YedF [Sulfurospirillum arcachonense]